MIVDSRRELENERLRQASSLQDPNQRSSTGKQLRKDGTPVCQVNAEPIKLTT